jgi:RNA polymerase sigma factor for flagellar operon FliA
MGKFAMKGKNKTSPRAPTADAADLRQQLIASAQGLVRNIAWRIHRKLPQHIEMEDLVGYAQLGLAQAACDFDVQRGVAFTTYAYHRIRGAVFDGLSEMAWFDQGAYHGGRYENPEEQAAGDAGSSAEPWAAQLRASLDAIAASEESAQGEHPDQSGRADPQLRVMHQELCVKLRELVERLPPDAASIIRWAYYEGLSLKEAGQKLGISKAWASRLHARTIHRLAMALRLLGYAREA